LNGGLQIVVCLSFFRGDIVGADADSTLAADFNCPIATLRKSVAGNSRWHIRGGIEFRHVGVSGMAGLEFYATGVKFVKTKRNSHRLVVAGCCLLDPPPAEIPTEVRFSKTRIVTHDPKPPVEFLQSRRSNGLKEKCYLFSWQRSYEKTPTLTNIGSNRKSDWNLLCKASRWEPTPASSKHSCRLPH